MLVTSFEVKDPVREKTDIDLQEETLRLLNSQLRRWAVLYTIDARVLAPPLGDTEAWLKIGEEYQHPLLVTGKVLFEPMTRAGIVEEAEETFDQYGERHVETVRVFRTRKGFYLDITFIFIDGHTGGVIHTERFREEVLYPESVQVPALAGYFELMDRIMADFLQILTPLRLAVHRTFLIR